MLRRIILTSLQRGGTTSRQQRRGIFANAATATLSVVAGAAILTSSFNDNNDCNTAFLDRHCHCEQQAPPSTTTTTTLIETNTLNDDGNKNQLTESSNSHQSSPSSSSSFRLKDVYDVQQVLGQGAYGMVYKARRKTDGVPVALKTMPREFTGKTDFEREVAALQLLSKRDGGGPNNNHVVRLYDLHRDENNYYLALELVEGGELLEHLIANGPYSEKMAASFLRQFAEAICFVHSTGLTHADLKPENILLEASNNGNNMSLKVVDFGCACTHDMGRQEMQLPAQEFAMGCSFLHQAALGNQFELARALQDRPNLVNFRDYDKRTALHVAASEGHLDLCRYLVERGAIINRVDRWGGTPLDDAHRHGHAAVVQFLGQRGGAFASTSSKQQTTHFIEAASQGDVEEVKLLLSFGDGINVNEGDYDRRTALHLAAGEGRLAVVKLLCEAGANVNVEDRWGNRPIDDAKIAKKNSASMIKLLESYGAMSSGSTISSSTKARQKGKENPADLEENNVSGTIAYWAPELFLENAKPTPAADMWAVGVIVYILLTGTHPFDKHANNTDKEIADLIGEVGRRSKAKDEHGKGQHLPLMDEIVFDERIEGLSDSCIELMKNLMTPDPNKRMTSEDFRRHPWIQGLTASWKTLEKAHSELEAFWQNRFRAEILKKFSVLVGGSTSETVSEEDLKRMFDALDLRKNGVLELEEILTTFGELGMTDKSIRQIFEFSDLDGTGVIRWDEFRALMGQKLNNSGPGLKVEYLQNRFKSHVLNKFGSSAEATHGRDRLREIFNSIDLEGNGFLDPHEIRVLLRSMGEPEDVISKIMASLDINQVGGLSWSDFQRIMGSNN